MPPWPGLDVQFRGVAGPYTPDVYRVQKMRYPKIVTPEESSKKVADESTVIFNDHITVTGIPWVPTNTCWVRRLRSTGSSISIK